MTTFTLTLAQIKTLTNPYLRHCEEAEDGWTRNTDEDGQTCGIADLGIVKGCDVSQAPDGTLNFTKARKYVDREGLYAGYDYTDVWVKSDGSFRTERESGY